MKIALTGSSSTGKTTLAEKLRERGDFHTRVPHFLTTNARELLESLGHRSMDEMAPDALERFQRAYLDKKLAIEKGIDKYLTDRSFVDVAAYWLERDAKHLPPSERNPLVETCRMEASRYDLHVFLPFGLIPFKSDGYRSEDQEFHKRLGEQISRLIHDWGLKVVRIDTASLDQRVTTVLKNLPAQEPST